MDGELWKVLYPVVEQESKNFARRFVHYSDAQILEVYLWAVLHDRPICWACKAQNWPVGQRPAQLPVPGTMSKRLGRLSVWLLLLAVLRALQQTQPRHLVQTVDAKPLPIGGYSKDRGARWGRATAGLAKGYKLFGIVDGGGQRLEAWEVGPMNESELKVAGRLLPTLTQEGWQGYVLGDSLYDTNPLHRQIAAQHCQLLAPRKKPRGGLGHRSHHASRLRALALLPTPFGQQLYALRTGIERYFGQATSFGGGLGPLPSWVRTPRRVTLWVGGKIVINAARLARHRPSPAAA
jgi:hypothetical protein